MTYPAKKRGATDAALRIHQAYLQMTQLIERAQTEVAGDRFNAVVEIPDCNRKVQSIVADMKSLGINTQIVEETNRLYSSSVTLQDINAFLSAINDLASGIELNASAFAMSFNPTTKKPEFVTPIPENAKTQIQTRLSAALALVS